MGTEWGRRVGRGKRVNRRKEKGIVEDEGTGRGRAMG